MFFSPIHVSLMITAYICIHYLQMLWPSDIDLSSAINHGTINPLGMLHMLFSPLIGWEYVPNCTKNNDDMMSFVIYT